MLKKEKLIPRRWKIWYFILPSLLGMMAFYFIPALISLYHGTTGFGGRFVVSLDCSLYDGAFVRLLD